MKKIFYLIGVVGGVEPFVRGPFRTEIERDNFAQSIHELQEEDDSLFYADIDKKGVLVVGSYNAGFFMK